jgi:hypothetical protein
VIASPANIFVVLDEVRVDLSAVETIKSR